MLDHTDTLHKRWNGKSVSKYDKIFDQKLRIDRNYLLFNFRYAFMTVSLIEALIF